MHTGNLFGDQQGNPDNVIYYWLVILYKFTRQALDTTLTKKFSEVTKRMLCIIWGKLLI